MQDHDEGEDTSREEYFCHNTVMKCLSSNSFQSIDFSRIVNIRKKGVSTMH